MSLDIILYAPGGKADMIAWAKVNPPANPLLDEDDEGNMVTRPGVSFCWWAGSGQFKTANGTYDGEGNEITPPTFAPGAVGLLRIHTILLENTHITDQTYDENGNPQLEQWERNQVAKWIKDNGTPGTMAGGTVPYYEVGTVRLLRPQDAEAFMAANNIAGHVWVGGNSY